MIPNKGRGPIGTRSYLAEVKESFKVLGWAWKEFVNADAKRWGKRMLVILAISLVVDLMHPWVVSFIFNGLIQKDSDLILKALGAFVGLTVVAKVTDYVHAVCREWIQSLYRGSINDRSNELFLEKSLGQHMAEHGTLSASNVEKGRNKINGLLDLIIFDVVPECMTLVIALTLLWIISPVAGAIMTGAFVLNILWMSYVNRRSLRILTPLDSEFRRQNRHRVERWDKVVRVKTNGKEHEEVIHLRDWFTRIIKKDRDFWIWYIRHSIFRNMCTDITQIGIVAYGGWLVWTGAWKIGLLYPLFAWTTRVKNNMWRISHLERRLNEHAPSVRSMMDALMIPPDIADDASAIALDPGTPLSVELQRVTHEYDTARKDDVHHPVLQNVSFRVAPGEKVALLGRSGAGKTTVMRAVLRFMDPTSGSIFVNDTDLKMITTESWKNAVGYIPQEASIFDGSIRYNLLYGLTPEEREHVTDEQLWHIARMLQVDFGERLTEGLETRVGRDGVKLSGGEAQRVMIGAAALKRPKLMVIDEATSSLDAVTERRVHDGLKHVLTADMSALIITHRLPTVRDICSKFIVLRNAEELMEGDPQVEAIAPTFERLYEVSPTFRELADEQGVIIRQKR